MLKKAIVLFVNMNRAVSRAFDRLLPEDMVRDGNGTFIHKTVPGLLRAGMTVYDVGGGSRPFLTPARRAELSAKVVGLDISAEELAAAPAGSYDKCIVADLAKFRGDETGDLVICQSTLEHVRDVEGALLGVSSSLRVGGVAAIFAPCRNAIFAKLNVLLPQRLKERVLFSIFPEKADGHDGFPAFYDRCTPKEVVKLAEACGLKVIDTQLYWKSSYFSFFFPAYLLWRAWTLFARYILGQQYCETFGLVLEKVSAPESGHDDRGSPIRRRSQE